MLYVGHRQYSENIEWLELIPVLTQTPENKNCVGVNFNTHMVMV